ncbi:MAG: glycosyl hydrolase 53 family protein [Aeromonadaceae bacterium]|nr:glycosyl hydrolase 53 family protein [Aeromonadaceae bacterium]
MINRGRPRAWAHWVGVLLCTGLLLGGCGGGGSGSSSNDDSTDDDSSSSAVAVRGVDISMLETVEDAGGTFQLNGTSQDLLPLLKSQGVNLVRLRLWVDPKSTSNEVYGGGDSDLARVIRLAKRAKAQNMAFMLDLHYSDFWTDPGKQFKPKAWAALSTDELVAQVQSYTQDVIGQLITAGVAPDYVQIGNELNSGMLWPTGKNWAANGETVGGFDVLARLLSAGVTGLRAAETAGGVTTPAKTILHLAEGGNNSKFRWWFDEITKRKVSFDIIGISYYPYWHGTLAALQSNMNDMVSRYSKPVMVVETAYAFTLENGDSLGNNFGQASDATNGGYPATAAGQRSFLKDLKAKIAAVPNGQGLGFVYWEPDWLPVNDATWATDAGISYLNTTGNVGNAWENQALFDFSGDALPALAEFAAGDQ